MHSLQLLQTESKLAGFPAHEKFVENANFLALSVALFNDTEIKWKYTYRLCEPFSNVRGLYWIFRFFWGWLHMQAVFLSCEWPGYEAKIRNALKIRNFRF